MELKLGRLKGFEKFEKNGFPGETLSVDSAVVFRKDFSELCSTLHMCGVRRSKLIFEQVKFSQRDFRENSGNLLPR